MSLFEKIQTSLNTLSKAKRNVAYYILDNWLEAAFLSASQVARKAKVSESVVVRFSQDLGYTGFPDFQRELEKILKTRLAGSDFKSPEKANNIKCCNDDLIGVYNKSIGNIDDVFKNNSIDTFVSFKDKITVAKRIIILARKNSFGPAYLLNIHLNEIDVKSRVIEGDTVEALDCIRGLSKQDLVIFISVPAYSRRMRLYSDYLKEKEVPQISITNSYSNKIAKNSESVLLTSVGTISFTNSHLGTIFIIDVLLYLLTKENKVKLLKFFEESKVLNERFGLTDS